MKYNNGLCFFINNSMPIMIYDFNKHNSNTMHNFTWNIFEIIDIVMSCVITYDYQSK